MDGRHSPGAYPHTPALNANATSGAKEAIPAGSDAAR